MLFCTKEYRVYQEGIRIVRKIKKKNIIMVPFCEIFALLVFELSSSKPGGGSGWNCPSNAKTSSLTDLGKRWGVAFCFLFDVPLETGSSLFSTLYNKHFIS